MAAAASLPEAADQAYDNLFPLWSAGTLKARLIAFANSLIVTPDLFPEEFDNNHPVSNWCALILSLTEAMHPIFAPPITGAAVPYPLLNSAANFIYRLCWVSEYLRQHTMITTSQANAILAAYNLNF